MADRVDVKLKAKDPNNETTTTTISYINPEASNSAMKQFAQKLNALTRNTYSESDKIETTNLDLAPDSGQQTATLTLAETTITLTEFNAALTGTGGSLGFKEVIITYDGDGQLSLAFEPLADNSNPMCIAALSKNPNNNNRYLWFGQFEFGNRAGTVRIKASATENYKAAEATYTITS